MDTLEIDGSDEQLARAVEADASNTPVATRAAMRARQGLPSTDPHYSDWLNCHQAECARQHEMTERLVRVLVLAVCLGIYFGWLA